ncbi:ion channel [Sphingobacterium griseoflavum]|uniref:Potassium channel domain-containing protein n=1 Tax=Sphingobacterium griseoflavum TaxID=1474952 RepID=A0ABQ3HWU6_9SPHI|nr:ion channel [Sphingobacterium griseoflavum]GHE34005.1 hypothetical protein GCM10017764_16630 [Sphingobacterium griseoflavum]
MKVRKYFSRFRTFWLEDLSFVVLLIMLFLIVFIIPIVMENSEHGILLFNMILLSLFFSGIFSTPNKKLIFASSTLFVVHCVLRLVRYTDNPYSFYAEENIVAVLNAIVFIIINLNLLFRNDSVNIYRIIGAINVYLLFALVGAFSLEIINALTGVSIAGDIELTGQDQDYIHFIYFSIVSLTTVGYGDIHPVSVTAKMLSVFMSTVGILFPAVVIARLVGMSYASKDGQPSA